nr:reverse transcriptase domain-containing protein [Tanacetum cinerariifolium]
MNYHPVITENQTNSHAGFQDTEKAKEEGTHTYKSVSHDIHSSSSGAQTRKQEFKECTNNNSNGVNAASTSVSTAGHNFINSTNDFSAAGPSNAAASPTAANSSSQDASASTHDSDMPNLEELTHSDDADDVGAEADINNLESIISVLPINDARVVVTFLKSLFSRFGTPKAIISDRGTHFCNDQFSRVMAKYGVTHRLSTAYHPQTSGQVEVTNCGLKRILERTVGENRASWSDKLEDALWAFRTAFKTSALKHANFDLKTAGDHRKLQLNKLNELRDQAYENSLIYKEQTKKLHDDKIKNRIFNVGDQVLLFNSRLKIFSGKLKSRWSGPFTISEIYPYGTAKLIHLDGCNFKVNCHRLKHYHGGDPPPLEIPDVTTFPKDN